MKSLLLSLTTVAIAASAIPTARAEDAKPNRPKREGRAAAPGSDRVNPEERLKKMTEALGLSQDQQDKIKAIMEGSRGELGKLRDLPEDQRREKMREAFKAQQEKIAEVLTPEQKEKYKATMQQRAQGARGPGDRKPGEGGRKPEQK